jgi:hypothetical protein
MWGERADDRLLRDLDLESAAATGCPRQHCGHNYDTEPRERQDILRGSTATRCPTQRCGLRHDSDHALAVRPRREPQA